MLLGKREREDSLLLKLPSSNTQALSLELGCLIRFDGLEKVRRSSHRYSTYSTAPSSSMYHR
jgi:hypothetical protein